jgi:putative phosphoesterase
MLRLGVISDTHGLLRPEAVDFLRGCEHIVHGGDIGNANVLAQLAALAPLTAVRGNNDTGKWGEGIPDTALVEVAGVRIHVIHDLALIDVDPVAMGVQVVVSGHSHRPKVEQRGGVLYLNPGSAGPRRFRLPVAVGEVVVRGGEVEGRFVELM